MEFQNEELDYNWLIMKQLDRIGHLSAQVLNDIQDDKWDEVKTFNLLFAVNTLRNMIPEELHDTNYVKEMKKLDSENVLDSEGVPNPKHVYERINARQVAIVNLLARTGYLLKKKATIN